MNVPALSLDGTDESRRIRLTRRAAVAGGVAALTGCLGGTSRGITNVVVYNPTDDSREVSVRVTEGDESKVDRSFSVPPFGSVTLYHSVLMNQTVTATVSDGDREASTEWDVEGVLYAELTTDGIVFRRESGVENPRILRSDGETDILVTNDDVDRDVTVRVKKDGKAVFEGSQSLAPDTNVAFHDRLDAAVSVILEVAVEGGLDITERMSLDGVVTLVARIDDTISLDRNFAGTKTE